MEAAIRWSPGGTDDLHRFLLVDVAGNNITLNESQRIGKDTLQSRTVARYDKVPNFTAFDWSRSDSALVALGLSSGDASLVRIEPGLTNVQPLRVYPIKTQRKCNSITFSTESLFAVGLDRVRNDHSLTVYDVNSGKEPHSRLCTGEAVSSIRFFPRQPQELVAAVARTTLRLYDLREPSYSSSSSASSVYTKQVNNIAIDPMDDHYFASGGSTGDPTVSVWDKRSLARPSSSSTGDGSSSTPVLELRPAVDNTYTTTVWSIRYSGLKRGRFGVLASTGEVKLYDMATHSAHAKARSAPANFYGGNPWSIPQYIARTHSLQYPYHDNLHGQSESARVIAFDWITTGTGEGQSVLALRPTREVGLLHTPDPGLASLTPRDDLAITRSDVALLEPQRPFNSVADDISVIKSRVDEPQDINQVSNGDSRQTSRLNSKSLSALRSSSFTAKRTEKWIEGDFVRPDRLVTSASFADSLTLVNIHRRRCQEGYRFDCKRNKEIVKEDSALSKLWAIVERLEGLAADGGMVTGSLDLSFLGVHSIWHGRAGESKNRRLGPRTVSPPPFLQSLQELVESHRLPNLEGLPSKTVYKRLLGLEICGWCFSREGIESKCMDLLEQGQHYRAVAIAVFQGHTDLSLDILRNLARNKIVQNTGVGALLASEHLNEEQREMCRWMEEDASDIYLKALLSYLGSRDWRTLVNSESLNLSDRLAVALRYIPDSEVTKFIDDTTSSCIRSGNVSGVLLTGLCESSMDLFQAYIVQTDDLQTAVLATAFTNPLYVDDVRWAMWNETYLWQMQAWRTFIERTKFTTLHARRAVTQTGERLVKPAPRQITVRCAHCNGSLAKQPTDTAVKDKRPSAFDSPSGTSKGTGSLAAQAQRISDATGTACPKCGRHLPRCSVCMQWLGTPDTVQVPRRTKEVEREIDGGKETGAAKRETELLSRFVTFCINCGHGFHAHHAKHWFAKHGMCPVPDCRCLCGLRG